MNFKLFLASAVLFPVVALSTVHVLSAEQAMPRGIENVGNTCFMNAVLQNLYNMSDLANLLLSKKNYYKPDSDVQEYIDFVSHYKSAAGGVISPGRMAIKVCEMFDEPDAQQDADEFVTQILADLVDNEIQDEVKKNLPKYSDGRTPKSDVSDLFYSQVSSVVSYAPENFVSDAKKIEPFATLALPMKKGDATLTDCFNNFFAGENVEGYKLPSNKVVTAQKKLSLEETNPYLILTLKRYEAKTDAAGKNVLARLNEHLSFPLKGLNLAPYFATPEKNKGAYELIGMTMHGGSISGGHYAAYIKSGSQWYYCNDSVVTEVSQAEIEAISQRGYGQDRGMVPTTFFYQLSSTRPVVNQPEPIAPVLGKPVPVAPAPVNPVVRALIRPRPHIPAKTGGRPVLKPVMKAGPKPVRALIKARAQMKSRRPVQRFSKAPAQIGFRGLVKRPVAKFVRPVARPMVRRALVKKATAMRKPAPKKFVQAFIVKKAAALKAVNGQVKKVILGKASR